MPSNHSPIHRTPSGNRRQSLKRTTQEGAGQGRPLPADDHPRTRGPPLGQGLQGETEAALAEAGALKLPARLEDLTAWQMKTVKESRKGSRTYSYRMASWREGGRTRAPQGAAGRWMAHNHARRPGRGKRRRWGCKACNRGRMPT